MRTKFGLLCAALSLGAALVGAPVAGAGTITDAVAPNTIDFGTSFCSDQGWSGWHSFDLSAHGVFGPVRVTSVTLPFEGFATLRVYADPNEVFPGSTPHPADGPDLLWAGQVFSGSASSFTTVPVNATVRTGHRVLVEMSSSRGTNMGLGVSIAGDNYSSYVTGCNGSYPNPFPLPVVGGFPWSITTVPADLTPPVIAVPSYVDVPAISTAGATVNYSASAADDTDGPLTYGQGPGHFVCHPDPGSAFPIGDTWVNCFAVDSASNIGSASFVVHVQGADEQLARLIVDSFNLGKLGTSLHDKLVSIQRFLADSKRSQACDNLAAFLSQVRSQTGKGLTTTQGTNLTESAQRIRTLIGC